MRDYIKLILLSILLGVAFPSLAASHSKAVTASQPIKMPEVTGAPKFSKLVYVNYTSVAIADSLPSSFDYPNAGTIQWKQVDQKLNPLSGTSTIDVNGAYDVPTVGSAAAHAGCTAAGCDPDFGLKCLINKNASASGAPNPGCPVGTTTMVDLLKQNGSSAGYVDYVRAMKPVYDNVETPAGCDPDYGEKCSTNKPAGSGVYASAARVVVSVDNRNWVQASGEAGTPFKYTASFLKLYAYTDTDPNPSAYYNPNGTGTPMPNNGVEYIVLPSYGTSTLTLYAHTGGANCVYTGFWPGDCNGGFISGGGTYTAITFKHDSQGYVSIPGTNLIFGNPPAPAALERPELLKANNAASFQNKGHTGYEVQQTVDRYFVKLDGSYQKMGTKTIPGIAPTQAYNKTVALPAGSTCGADAFNIIDPVNTTQVYDYRNDTVNTLDQSKYLYVAPIVGCP